MTKTDRRWIVFALVLLDAIGVGLALIIAYWLRIYSGLLPERVFDEFALYLKVSLLIVPIWLTIFAFNKMYDLRLVLSGVEVYTQIAKSSIYAMVAIIMLGYWVRIATLSRGWLLLAWFFGVLFVGGFRFLLRRVIYWQRRRGRLRTRTLILGANEQGKAIARQFQAADGAGLEIVGFIDDFLPSGALVSLDDFAAGSGAEPLRVLGGPDRLRDVVRNYSVTEVVVVTNAVAWETFQEIMQDLNLSSEKAAFEIKLSPGFYEILNTGVQVTHDAYVPLLVVNRQRITGVDAVLKGLLDYGLALLNMIVALPAMLLIAVVLRLGTRRPVIDRHQVLACGGGTFVTRKFHTGLDDTPRPLFAHPLTAAMLQAGGGVQVATATAEEVTALHRLLYSTGLDKLPQLFNILRGEMSWVGPRTISLGQAEVHSPWLPNLLTVKPGITGPWAVGAKRTLDDEMRLTMYYIRNWTIWLDLQILLQTIQRILRLEREKARLPER